VSGSAIAVVHLFECPGGKGVGPVSFVDALTDRLGAPDPDGGPAVYRKGTVVAASGSTLVVHVDGVDVAFPAVRRLTSYVPVAGDEVACLRTEHRYVILGRIAATP